MTSFAVHSNAAGSNVMPTSLLEIFSILATSLVLGEPRFSAMAAPVSSGSTRATSPTDYGSVVRWARCARFARCPIVGLFDRVLEGDRDAGALALWAAWIHDVPPIRAHLGDLLVARCGHELFA